MRVFNSDGLKVETVPRMFPDKSDPARTVAGFERSPSIRATMNKKKFPSISATGATAKFAFDLVEKRSHVVCLMHNKPVNPNDKRDKRSGVLAAGNWIIDHVKVIDTWPAQDALATIGHQTLEQWRLRSLQRS